MSNISAATSNQLTSALHVLGVNFLMGETYAQESFHRKPALLIAALAESREARLRLSLIPLFLEHPEFSKYVRQAVQGLGDSARLILQCYYTAALLLQKQYRTELDPLIGRKQSLPDLFSAQIGLPITANPRQDLKALAKQHESLSGARVNWLGTYQHAIQVWLKGLEMQKP